VDRMPVEQQVTELERKLPTLEQDVLEISYRDAGEFFELPEIVATYHCEIVRRAAQA
jgi:hypothetical protein